MMRTSQSRNDLAFHKPCKGPGAGINLACQRIFKDWSGWKQWKWKREGVTGPFCMLPWGAERV